MKPRALLIGAAGYREFAEATAAILARTDCRRFAKLKDAAAALGPSNLVPPVDLIVIVQLFPGEHRQYDLDRVRKHYPITPIVFVLGSWCEGETRTGRPLLPAHRLFWYDWPLLGEPELTSLERGEFSTWQLPPTAAEEEIFLESAKRPLSMQGNEIGQRQGKIVWVFTENGDYEINRLFGAILATSYETVEYVKDFEQAENKPNLFVWDIGERDRAGVGERLRTLRERFPKSRIVLFCRFPRFEERRALLEAGADVLISQPFDLIGCCLSFLAENEITSRPL